jgi:hypothetical protein
MTHLESKRESVWQPWWGPVAVVALILIGYHKIFLGYNLFIHEDWIALSNHTFGNKFSNGWRPDKGLGLSNFYGDPGMWHPWSLLTFLERLSPTRMFAHNFSVIFLDSAAALSVYFFSRRMLPRMNVWIPALVSPIVVFCFDQPAYHYAGSFIAVLFGSVLLSWILFKYYQNPRWIHIFAAALLFWSMAFMGNLWALTQILMLGLVFSLSYRFYFKLAWGTLIRRFLTMYVPALFMVLLLGAYVFYSFGLEQLVTGYVREKSIRFPGLVLLPDYKQLIVYLCGFFPFEAIPINHDLAGFTFLPYRLNVSPVFIFVFLFFLSRKAENFWEFALKTLLAVFFIHGFLANGKLLPGYSALYSVISNQTSKLITMYDFVFALETVLIIYFLSLVTPKNVVVEHPWGRRLQVVIATGTVFCYSAVLAVCVISQAFPQQYLALTDRVIPALFPSHLEGYSRELLSSMLSYNARRFQELVTPQMTAFFVVTIIVVGVFLKDTWLRRAL